MLFFATTTYPGKQLVNRARARNISYMEMSPWIPSLRFRKFSTILFPRIGQILDSRSLLTDEELPHHLNLSVFSNYEAFCRHILKRQPNPAITSLVRQIETKRINQWISRCNVSVITSDFLNSKLRLSSNLNLVEFRWHHTHLNSKRIPIQLSFPSYYNPLEFNDHKFNQLLAEADKTVHFYTFYSNLAAKSFIDFAGITPSKVLVTPLVESFEDIEHGDFAEERTLDFLYVGRGEYDKGVDIAIALAKTVNRRLTIIGSFKPKIAKWIKSFKFVDFLGNLPRSEVYKAMRKHKILLATGTESFGIAIMEALNQGMLIVGTEMCGSLNYSTGCARVFVSKDNNFDSLHESVELALRAYVDRVSLLCNHSTIPNDWEKVMDLIESYSPSI